MVQTIFYSSSSPYMIVRIFDSCYVSKRDASILKRQNNSLTTQPPSAYYQYLCQFLLCGEGVKAKITMTCKKECFPDCCRREVIESPCEIKKCKNSFGPWSDWSECTKPCILNIKERSIKSRSRICYDCSGNDNGKYSKSSCFLKQLFCFLLNDTES